MSSLLKRSATPKRVPGQDLEKKWSFGCGECDFKVSGPDLYPIRREFYFHMEFLHLAGFRSDVQSKMKTRIHKHLHQSAS